MSSLREYLVQKRDALLARREKARMKGAGPHQIAGSVVRTSGETVNSVTVSAKTPAAV
jgi:hypothetical protein